MNHVEAREFAHRMMKSWRTYGLSSGYFGYEEWADWMKLNTSRTHQRPNLHHLMQGGDFLETQMKIVAFLTDEGNDDTDGST